jgi:hypothetical protein
VCKTTCFRYVILNYVVITFIQNSDVLHFYCELYVSCELWLLNQYDLGCMLVGLKSHVISRNLGLYEFKFGKLTASVEDFSDLISYNYVDPLQQQRYQPTPTNIMHITLDLRCSKAFIK